MKRINYLNKLYLLIRAGLSAKARLSTILTALLITLVYFSPVNFNQSQKVHAEDIPQPRSLSKSAGKSTSIKIGANGLPVISYLDGTNHALKVVNCGDAACSSGNVFALVDGCNNCDYDDYAGSESSLSIGNDGFPIISYLARKKGSTDSKLKVVKCGNVSCSSGNTFGIANPDEIDEMWSDSAIGHDGLPIISYYDYKNLKVVKCGNSSCSNNNIVTLVDNEESSGEYSSIVVGADGFPVISYYKLYDHTLKVMKCGNAACSSGNVRTTLDSLGKYGYFSSIALGADGLPVISYNNSEEGLKVLKCGNAACSAGNTITVVDGFGNYYGALNNITIGADGFPIISYHDIINRALKVAKCGNAACSAGNVVTTVDIGEVGNFNDIAIGTDGLPIISYYDGAHEDLKVVKCGNAACSSNNQIYRVDDPPFLRTPSITPPVLPTILPKL